MGFKDFQDWTGPDTGLTISEKIKILKLFELDNFGLKDQFCLVFVYFEQILMSFIITLIKECIANNYRCNIKPKITKNNYNWSKTKTFDEKYFLSGFAILLVQAFYRNFIKSSRKESWFLLVCFQ